MKTKKAERPLYMETVRLENLYLASAKAAGIFSAANEGTRYSFKDATNGMANDKLQPYTSEMRSLIEKKGNIIVDSYEKLRRVVNDAFDNRGKKATIYFGILPYSDLKKIESRIPNRPKGVKLFQDGMSYSIATTLDDIRHLSDGKELTKNDVLDYLDRLADTIADSDSVVYSRYERNGANGILCKKLFSDGTLISYSLMSNKTKTLKMQTLYLNSKDYQNKKRSLPTIADANAPADTSKTYSGQTSNDSLAQPEQKSNPLSEKNSEKDESRYSITTAQDRAYLPLAEKYQKGTVRSVRVLTPDGGEFELVKQKTELTSDRSDTNVVELPIGSVDNSIAQSEQKSNTFSEKSSEKDEKRYSVSDNAYGRQDKVFTQEDARSIG